MNRFLTLTAVAFVVVVICVGSAQAQNTIVKVNFQYAVKFVCGQSAEDHLQAVKGIYTTAVNVHNPGVFNAVFAEKIAIARPQEIAGPISKFRLSQLPSDAAFELTCEEFSSDTQTKFVTGFLVIESPVELDITAVYTARPSDGEVSTIDVETIASRKVRLTLSVEPGPQADISLVNSHGQLHFNVMGLEWQVQSTALSVFDLQGKIVYTSGNIQGAALNWNFTATNGRAVANGVYLAVITARGKLGQLITSTRKIAVSR
ncbi:hypothetical protein HY230_06445 [Candidatus Acetothermia bacterium]|nr:hypothetical protein [Candidatus Acetothermia bacterium]